MSHEGLARISGVPNGSTNLIVLDVEGTPSYDLPDTPEDEGAGIAPHADHVTESADALGIEGRVGTAEATQPWNCCEQMWKRTRISCSRSR